MSEAAPPVDPPAAPPPAPATAVPRLLPGVRVVTRGRDRLQVGLHPPTRTVLARTPVTERTLLALVDGLPPPPDPGAADVVAELDRSGCLAPAPQATPPVVAVVPLRGGGGLGTLVGPLLGAAGLVPAAPGSACDLTVVVAGREPDRDLLDPLLRAGTPHLVVRLVDSGVLVGPFVVPGETACLRCTDAHGSTLDPEHVPVLTRYVHAPAGGRDDRLPVHLEHLAAGWAVRDAAAHLRGVRPSTWSRTWHLAADGGPPHVRTWDRHPGCGCSWVADARPSGTMEA